MQSIWQSQNGKRDAIFLDKTTNNHKMTMTFQDQTDQI